MTKIKPFIERLLGHWLVQNTIYSLSNNASNTSVNKISWSIPKDKQKFINSMRKNIDKQYDQLSLIEIDNCQIKIIKYILFLYKTKSKTGIILKLNNKFDFLNSSSFYIQSYNTLYLDYNIKNINIIEKLYFINDNLKLIKSTIEQNDQYVTVLFSSEIKIK